MNILLLGKTGQVGLELYRSLSPLGDINAPARTELNLMDEGLLQNYLTQNKPELIVNAAGWTAVDAAEEQRESAERLNSNLPAQLAQYAAANHIRLVHFSSDYVYPGSGERPWRESSLTGPLNYYGKTKLEGDRALARSGADYLIFRTSWVYSAHGNNFMKAMLRLAESKQELDIVADQIGAPTPARLIAQITALAIHSRLVAGLYNLAPRGETSWHGFAKEIFRLAGQDVEVRPISTKNYQAQARRPLNSRLEVIKLERQLNIRLPDWKKQLEQTLWEYLE